MRCEKARCKLGPYADGELAPAMAQEICGHLAECPDCSAELARLSSLASLLSASPAPEVPEGLEAAILEAAPRDILVASRAAHPIWPTLLRTAAALLIALAGFYFGMRSSRQVSAPPSAPAVTDTAAGSVEGMVQESFALLPTDSPGAQLLALYENPGEGR